MNKLLCIIYYYIVTVARWKEGCADQHGTVVLHYYPKVKHSFPALWWDVIGLGSEERCMKQLLEVLKLAETRKHTPPPRHPPPHWHRTILIAHSNFIPHTRPQFPNKFLKFSLLGAAFQMHHKNCSDSGELEPETSPLPDELRWCALYRYAHADLHVRWWYPFYAL